MEVGMVVEALAGAQEAPRTASRIGQPIISRENRPSSARKRSRSSDRFAGRTAASTARPAPPRPAPEPDCCSSEDAHHDWNTAARGETSMQRLDRNYAEILQEIRVAQTGVQLLLAFLLSLAFTPRFTTLTPFDKQLYVSTLLLGSASAALLMAPACYHRVVFRRRLKRHLVHAANRFAAIGLALLGLSLASAVLLILKIVVDQRLAVVLTAGVLLWFAMWWYVLPMWTALRHRH
jgi:hypothetical protein